MSNAYFNISRIFTFIVSCSQEQELLFIFIQEQHRSSRALRNVYSNAYINRWPAAETRVVSFSERVNA